MSAILIPAQLPSRIGLCGVLASGKDTSAEALNYSVVGFADPMYEIASSFGLPGRDKSAPGVRETLQKIGQWGRGVVSDRYPVSTERILFGRWITRHWIPAHPLWGLAAMDWGTPDFWSSGLTRRYIPADKRTAVTNVRFANEAELLSRNGWSIYAVVCSDTEELRARQLRATGGNLALTHDVSEELATHVSAHLREGRPVPDFIRGVIDTAKSPYSLDTQLPILHLP